MTAGSSITVCISPGELFDKITILQIKTARITDPDKASNISDELSVLEKARDAAVDNDDEVLEELIHRLRTVNERLWEIEDDIRLCERKKQFGSQFVELARSVYCSNDERAAIKREINVYLGASFQEEKSYQSY